MANETQTRTGTCPTHGTVEATRETHSMTLGESCERSLSKTSRFGRNSAHGAAHGTFHITGASHARSP
jgi:hypothetical protein